MSRSQIILAVLLGAALLSYWRYVKHQEQIAAAHAAAVGNADAMIGVAKTVISYIIG